MMDVKFSIDFTEPQIKALLLLMKRQSALDSVLKPLYDTFLDYIYDTMTIEEAEKYFNES
jgi:hypothetical protein